MYFRTNVPIQNSYGAKGYGGTGFIRIGAGWNKGSLRGTVLGNGMPIVADDNLLGSWKGIGDRAIARICALPNG